MNGPRRAPPIFEFGGFHLDTGRRQLRSPQGELAGLPANAFDILQYLVEHYGQLVEKSALMKAAWPNVVVEEGNLSQGIFLLRRALGERAGEDRFIMTVPGRGFRFVAPVKVLDPADDAAAATVRTIAPRSTTPRIAIMPFENLSPDPANAFFADGLHDEILATLAQRTRGLQVISRTTMMRYRGQPAPMPQIAAELGADYVVEGTVRREAERVRVTLQLIDARDDSHLWAQSYDRTLKSALTLQSEIAGDVASRLAARFVGKSAAPPTRNSEAYDLFLRARLLGQQVTAVSPRGQWTEVAALISRAIELDPEFSSAYAFRAGFQTEMFAFNYDNSDELVGQINADLAAARRLAPRDPLALAAAAANHLWIEVDPKRALSAYQEADAAGLNEAQTLSSYAMVMERLGRGNEVYDLICRAIELDPANPFLIATSAVTFSILGRLVEAINLIDRGIRTYPERRFLRLVRAQLLFVNLGHIEQLRSELKLSSRQLSQESLIDLNFRTLLCAGAYDELQRLLDAIPESEIRMVPGLGGGGAMFGVGNRPMAQFHGWVALLRGDAAEAARQGAAVLEFCARSKPTLAGSGFHRSLSVEGHLFMGQRDRAIAAARATVSAINPDRDAFGRFSVFYAARCLAWIGEQDEAVSLLESQSIPNITRIAAFCCHDPSLTTPLAGNARFAALTARLEAGLAERASQLSGIISGRGGA